MSDTEKNNDEKTRDDIAKKNAIEKPSFNETTKKLNPLKFKQVAKVENKASVKAVAGETDQPTKTFNESVVDITTTLDVAITQAEKWNKVAIWTTVGNNQDDTLQEQTGGWLEVNKDDAIAYIGKKNYILENLPTKDTFWLNTSPFVQEGTTEVSSVAKSLIWDLPLKVGSLSTDEIADFYVIDENDASDVFFANLGLQPKKSVMARNLSPFDAQKVFKAVFSYLSNGQDFPNQENITLPFVNSEGDNNTGQASNSNIQLLKDAGFSCFAISTDKLWLRTFMVGGVEALFYYNLEYVKEKMRPYLATGYNIYKNDTDLNAFRKLLNERMGEFLLSGIIDYATNVSDTSITKGSDFLVEVPTAKEMKDSILRYGISYYKSGRVQQMSGNITLKGV